LRALHPGAFYETIKSAASKELVTPVKTGVQNIYMRLKMLDSGSRFGCPE